jgi:hypothetical protein
VLLHGTLYTATHSADALTKLRHNFEKIRLTKQ